METAKDTASQLIKVIEQGVPEEPKLCTRLQGGEHAVFQILFIDSYDLIVTASYDEVIRVYSLDTKGTAIVQFQHSDRVRAIALLFDDVVVSASVDGMLRTWHASTGKLISLFNMGIDIEQVIGLTCIATLDETRFVIGSATGVLFVVSHESAAALSVQKRIRTAHSKWISAISLHSNIMYTCSLDESIKVWDTRLLKEIQVFHLGKPITSLAISDRLLVAGCSNGSLHVRSKTPPYPVLARIETLESNIRSLQVVSDNLVYFTASGRLSFISLESFTRISLSYFDHWPFTSATILRGGNIALGGEFGFVAIASSPSPAFQSVARYSSHSYVEALKHSSRLL